MSPSSFDQLFETAAARVGIARGLHRVEACGNISSGMVTRKTIDDLKDGNAIRIVWGRSASGRYHGEEFFNKDLNEHQRSEFFALFELVGEKGRLQNEKSFRYPMKNCGNLGEFKIFKKRLFFYRSGDDFIITHGATKKKNETDPNDIDRANRLKKEIESQERQADEQANVKRPTNVKGVIR